MLNIFKYSSMLSTLEQLSVNKTYHTVKNRTKIHPFLLVLKSKASNLEFNLN